MRVPGRDRELAFDEALCDKSGSARDLVYVDTYVGSIVMARLHVVAREGLGALSRDGWSFLMLRA